MKIPNFNKVWTAIFLSCMLFVSPVFLAQASAEVSLGVNFSFGNTAPPPPPEYYFWWAGSYDMPGAVDVTYYSPGFWSMSVDSYGGYAPYGPQAPIWVMSPAGPNVIISASFGWVSNPYWYHNNGVILWSPVPGLRPWWPGPGKHDNGANWQPPGQYFWPGTGNNPGHMWQGMTPYYYQKNWKEPGRKAGSQSRPIYWPQQENNNLVSHESQQAVESRQTHSGTYKSNGQEVKNNTDKQGGHGNENDRRSGNNQQQKSDKDDIKTKDHKQ